jgi:hypothetical protein
MNRGFIMKTLLFMCITVLTITVFGQSVLAKSSIDDPKQLLVTSVYVDFVDSDIALHIYGRCFDNGSDPEIPPTVTIGGIELQAAQGFTDTYMEVTVPGGLDDGDYLMSVSTGANKSQNDAYNLTIRAAGSFAPTEAMCEYFIEIGTKTNTQLPPELVTLCPQFECPCFTAATIDSTYVNGWPYPDPHRFDDGPFEGVEGDATYMEAGSGTRVLFRVGILGLETMCIWEDTARNIRNITWSITPQQYDRCRQDILNSNLWNTFTQ